MMYLHILRVRRGDRNSAFFATSLAGSVLKSLEGVSIGYGLINAGFGCHCGT